MNYEDVVVLVLLQYSFWVWAIRSIYKNRLSFMSTEIPAQPQRTPYMNRIHFLYPENDIIDVEWEDVTHIFERRWETHHLVNLMIASLVGLYFFSDWIAKFIVWLIFIIT